MAYQTGTVNSLADIQTVIRVFLTDNGWTWDAGTSTIYKDSIFIGFLTPASDKALFRAMDSLGGTSTAGVVGVGQINLAGAPFGTLAITFPATYWLFLNDDEFYFVVNYSATRYQYVTWGRSTVDVGAATGTFISGSVNGGLNQATSYSMIAIGTNSGGNPGWWGAKSCAPFWDTFHQQSSVNLVSDYVHTNLGGETWTLSPLTSPAYFIGVGSIGNLLGNLPNSWNGESPLIPIRAYRWVAESKISLVLDLQHSRYCRVDNFNDAEVISIGLDEWQVFPFHRKNIAARDGANFIDHTGTLGWAIRKVD